jgi:hypothetical protein
MAGVSFGRSLRTTTPLRSVAVRFHDACARVSLNSAAAVAERLGAAAHRIGSLARYLYRAVDKDGDTIDFLAGRYFEKSIARNGWTDEVCSRNPSMRR